MYFCDRCNQPMIRVTRFENGKVYQFMRCRNCFHESKKIPITIKNAKTRNSKKNIAHKKYVKNKRKRYERNG